MAKLTVTEAEKLVPVGKSTIYADMEAQKLSFERNARGHKVIDTAELERVYGLLRNPNFNATPTGNQNGMKQKNLETTGNGIGTHLNGSETAETADETTADAAFLQREIVRLESELEDAGKREEKLEARTDKLLEMLAVEQEKTRLLMLPKPDTSETEPVQKKRSSWLGYFRLKR